MASDGQDRTVFLPRVVAIAKTLRKELKATEEILREIESAANDNDSRGR